MSEKLKQSIKYAKEASKRKSVVRVLVNRPREGVHETVEHLELCPKDGILGDRWKASAWLRLSNGAPDPRVQVSLTNYSVMECFAGSYHEGVIGCGDNIYTDLNLTEAALPIGALLRLGSATIRISDVINDACGKFAERFGAEAFQWIRSEPHVSLRLRGIFCQIVEAGTVCTGDSITVIE